MSTAQGERWLNKRGQPLDVDLIVSEHTNGMGVGRLSYRHQATLQRIRDLLRANNALKPGPGSRPPPELAPVEPEPPDDVVRIDPAEAMSMLWNGQSIEQVATHFDAEADSFREAMAKSSREFRRYLRETRAAEKKRRHAQYRLERKERIERDAEQRLRERQDELARRSQQTALRRQQSRERREAREAAEREDREWWETAHPRLQALWKQLTLEVEEREREQHREPVHELYEQGCTPGEIAEQLDLPSTLVREFLAEWGVDRPRWGHVTDTAIEDCWHDQVFLDHARELQAAARQVRGVTPQDSPLRRASEELSELLAMSVQAGVTAKFIADQLGITHGAVRFRVSRHGYAPMSPSQHGGYYGERPAKERETCKHGHPWNDENVATLSSGVRHCRQCQRRRAAEYNKRRRERAKGAS